MGRKQDNAHLVLFYCSSLREYRPTLVVSRQDLFNPSILRRVGPDWARGLACRSPPTARNVLRRISSSPLPTPETAMVLLRTSSDVDSPSPNHRHPTQSSSSTHLVHGADRNQTPRLIRDAFGDDPGCSLSHASDPSEISRLNPTASPRPNWGNRRCTGCKTSARPRGRVASLVRNTKRNFTSSFSAVMHNGPRRAKPRFLESLG